MSSLSKKQLTPHTTEGAACRAISSSVMTPSVPHAPIKKIDGVHVVRNEITRRVFGLGHGIAGKIQLKRAAPCRHERQVACVSVCPTSMKLEQVAVRQCHVKPRNVRRMGP